MYFYVYCLYAIDDTRCGALVSEVVPWEDFMINIVKKVI